jgi:biopolymer transport protein ExbD
MAALFLILVLCVFGVQRSPSVGFHVQMPRVQKHANWLECEDDIPIVILLHKDGSIFIRQTEERPDDLAPIIAKIMDYRDSERAVYLMPDPDVSFGDLARIFSKITASTPNLHVFLVTNRVRALLGRNPPDGWGICDFEWPENGYKAESWYAAPAAPREY